MPEKKRYGLLKMAATPLLMAVAISGCASFIPRPISPVRTASTFEARSLDNPGLKRFLESNLNRKITPWPQKSWDFPSLTLVSFYYHPDLDVVRAQWDVAKAGKITAGAYPNPTIGLIPGYDTSTVALSPWILGFSLGIPVETAGKRGYRLAQAGNLSEAARLNIATTAWRVRSRLRKSLLDVYAADQKLTLLESQLAGQGEIFELLKQRLAYGEIAQPELTQAHIFFDQANFSLKETQKQIAENRASLAASLGLPATALAGIPISFDFLEQVPAHIPLKDVRRRALLNRPDILAALSKYEAAQSALQLEIAGQYPDISLGPGYTWDQGDNKWYFGISLSLPVFNRHEGPIAEAEARRKKAAAEFTALQAQIIGETDRALAGYQVAWKNLEAADSLLVDKEKQLQSALAMFSVGESDRLALLSARFELASGRLSRLKALVLTQQALGLLEDALQRPLDPGKSFLIAPEADPRDDQRGINR